MMTNFVIQLCTSTGLYARQSAQSAALLETVLVYSAGRQAKQAERSGTAGIRHRANTVAQRIIYSTECIKVQKALDRSGQKLVGKIERKA